MDWPTSGHLLIQCLGYMSGYFEGVIKCIEQDYVPVIFDFKVPVGEVSTKSFNFRVTLAYTDRAGPEIQSELYFSVALYDHLNVI